MAFSIANGMGHSIDEPSPEQMEEFLFDVDTTDEEHGAAWLSTDDHVLEWSGADGGLLVFSTTTAERSDANWHLRDISRERTLELWQMLRRNVSESSNASLGFRGTVGGPTRSGTPDSLPRCATQTECSTNLWGRSARPRAASASAADGARCSGACSAGPITSSPSEARPARSTIESGGAKREAGLSTSRRSTDSHLILARSGEPAQP